MDSAHIARGRPNADRDGGIGRICVFTRVSVWIAALRAAGGVRHDYLVARARARERSGVATRFIRRLERERHRRASDGIVVDDGGKHRVEERGALVARRRIVAGGFIRDMVTQTT